MIDVVTVLSLILNFGIGVFVGSTSFRIKRVEQDIKDIKETLKVLTNENV